jgi:hypothetical protein
VAPAERDSPGAAAKGENYVADTDRQLTGSWREDRLLSFFLGFLVLMTIFVPMVGLSLAGRIAIDLTFALMLLSGAIATVYKRMLMYRSRADLSGIHSGPDRRIQPFVQPDGLGHGAQGVLHGNPCRHDA